MRVTILLLFLGAVICQATTLTQDLGVIGSPGNFLIHSVDVAITPDAAGTGDTVLVTLLLDTQMVTGSPSYLTSISCCSGPDLIMGDIFFYNGGDVIADPSDPAPGGTLYAVPMDSAPHPNYIGSPPVPGALYLVTSAEDANAALDNPQDYNFRPNTTVLMTSGTEVNAGNGVTISPYTGPGADAPPLAEYMITVSFDTTGTNFISDLDVDGQIGLLFSSADCANDVISGLVTVPGVPPPPSSTPEPQSLALIAGGLGMLIGVGAWRRFTGRKFRA